jgi:hypothetical protein
MGDLHWVAYAPGEEPHMASGDTAHNEEIYRVRVKGILDAKWSHWFDGMTIIPEASGETLLTGPIADQAALHGLLEKIRNLGLPLLSVERAVIDDESYP